MSRRKKQKTGILQWTSQHYILLLLLSFFYVAALGIPPQSVLMLCIGIALCICGIYKGEVCVDTKILTALAVYDVFSTMSSLFYYGSIAQGFALSQNTYTVIYLLMAYLSDEDSTALRRICGISGGVMAAYSIAVYGIVQIGTVGRRMTGFVDNANAYGVFFVICYFALISTDTRKSARFEVLILTALALTMSMSSFLALAAGLTVLFLMRRSADGGRSEAKIFMERCARVITSLGIGVLIYINARYIREQWLTGILFAYLIVAFVNWNAFAEYLRTSVRMTWTIIALGVPLAVLFVFLRPSAADTFAERVQMMESGLRYTFENPVLGVGPARWASVNAADGGVPFGVNHVHNLFLAIGSELGLVAMAALVFAAVRFFIKRGSPYSKAGGTALLTHSLLDTAFFYPAVAVTAILTETGPRVSGTRIKAAIVRIVLTAFIAVFIWELCAVALLRR